MPWKPHADRGARVLCCGVANRVVGDRLTVVAGQLVLPVAVAVDVGDRFKRCPDRACGVSVFDLGRDVSAAVGAANPRRVFMRIIT